MTGFDWKRPSLNLLYMSTYLSRRLFPVEDEITLDFLISLTGAVLAILYIVNAGVLSYRVINHTGNNNHT
jgi:hypothetical protein